ncbi:hypothetical protein FQA39_LY01178 [Lamprigera yunnana]|nr:hypothetical protein FQA39_LY01178 [Lamprigera yunnana]
MLGVSVFIFLVIWAEWSSAQFFNHRPYPTYSLEHMPDTQFSCRDKILGGYYADPETQCQMFHVCVKVSGVGVQDFRFLCPNGTAFDQDHQICADWQDVDCDATTLYYSSDNFDLYRIGSGFESKAVKYGEDEEPFSLQRAETGDVRINREHQSQRVNQQKETYGYKPRANEYQYQQQNSRPSHNNNNNNNERDIFKGSSSSNFFNNRNGGKETEEDDYDSAKGNTNQDNDQFQRRKNTVRKNNRRPTYEDQTAKPDSAFTNNFAGSSYTPSTTLKPVISNYNDHHPRQRQRGRINPQYSNAGNFRQTTNKNYEDDGRYRGENYNNAQYNRNTQTTQFTVSTPSPFRQNQNTAENRTPQYTPTTAAPQPQQSRSTENYPTYFNQDQSNYKEEKTNIKENYPTHAIQSQTQTKVTDNYSNYNNNPQGQQYSDQYETTKLKSYENYPSEYNAQNKKSTTPVKQTDNYPTTHAPRTNKDFKTAGFSEQFTTSAPQRNPTNTQTNQQETTYNRPSSQYSPTLNYHHQQYDNSRTTSSYSANQAQIYKQTPLYSPVPQQKQTTQHTQYTPTVPRITTPYYTSTTPAVRRSNRFDETQYDDGSYSSKYNNDDEKASKDDEFLKTAHSIDIARSRNEYSGNGKNIPVSTTQKPRPFSVTPNSFRASEYLPTSNSANTQNTAKPTTNFNNTPALTTVTNSRKNAQPPSKKGKDVSYDYAYYDTNVGSEHEYDATLDIEKSNKSKSKTQ